MRNRNRIDDLELVIDGLCNEVEILKQKITMLQMADGALNTQQNQDRERCDGKFSEHAKRMDRIEKIR